MRRLSLCLLTALLATAALAAPPRQDPKLRPQLCLNGEWDFQPDSANTLAFPPPANWDKVRIRIPSPWNVNSFSRGEGGDFNCFPSYPKAWETPLCAWHRRIFTAPADMRGKRVFVRFEAVLWAADVYLNGKRAGGHEGGFTPFELDVTDLVRFDQPNELIVGVKDRHLFDTNGRTPYGWGSFWGEAMRGIWQDVTLIARPQVYVADVFVKPSVATMALSLEVTVRNTSAREWSGSLGNAISPDGKSREVAKGLPSRSVTIPPGETRTLKIEQAWPDAKLWWPDSPQLYVLKTFLGTGDALLTRFGFKELKIGADKRKFTLNGVPFSGRADAWHFMGVPQMSPVYPATWYKMAKSANVNVIRLHAMIYPEFYLDVADEMGMLIVDETPLWGSAGNFYYNDDFWRRGRQVCEEFVRRDRNHPSVALWSVANEIYFCGDIKTSGAPSYDWIFAHYAELAQGMKTLDPTREVSSDGDNDLGGRLPIYSWHYPGPADPGVKKTQTIGESGSMYYSVPPEYAYLGGDRAYLTSNDRMALIGEESFNNIEGYRKWAAYATVFNLVWYGLEPLNFQNVNFKYPDLATPGMKPERLGAYSTMLNGGRDPELPDYIPNPLYGHVKDAFTPVRFFVRERSRQAYDGAPIVRHLTVHNDSLQAADLSLKWTLTRDKQPGVDGVVAIGKLAPGAMTEVEVRMTPPQATDLGGEKMPLRLTLLSGKEQAYQQIIPLRIYPRTLLTTAIARPGRVRLYDPKGTTAKLLAAMKVPVEPLARFGAAALSPQWLTVIGEGANVSNADAEALLGQLATSGGRLLVLTGNSGFAGATGVMPRGAGGYSIAFAKVPGHPALAGVDAGMLREWAPDNTMGGATFAGVPRYNVTPLITCRDAETAMLDARVGFGRMIATELPLVARAEVEPAAAVLFRNAVTAVGGPTGPEPAPASCLAGRSSKLLPGLRLMGAAVTDTPGGPTALIDGSRPPAPGIVKQAIASAQTVVLWNLTPEGLAALQPGLPADLKLRLTKADTYQLIRGKEHPLLTGVEHADIFGAEKDTDRIVMQYAVQTDMPQAQALLVTNHTDWRRWARCGENTKTGAIIRSEREPFTPRCGLLTLPCQGRTFVVNQVLFNPRVPKAARFSAQLLTNLQIGIAARNITPADLSAFNTDENGFIASWLLCGPFEVKDYRTAFDTDLLGGEAGTKPEAGLLRGGRIFGDYLASGPALDFKDKAMYGELSNAVVYAGTYVWVDADTTANLWMGSDDGSKAWLNGKLVYSNDGIGPVTPDQRRADGVTLKRGWNRLLVKVVQAAGNWGLCARFVDTKGQPLSDLRATALPDFLSARRELPRDKWVALGVSGDGRAALDGDPGTRWSTNAPQKPGQWFTLDFGAPQTFGKIVLDSAASAGDYPRGLKIETSDDGATWREIASIADARGCAPGGVMSLVVPPTTARHLRLTQTAEGLSGGLYWSIHELRVFE